MSFNFVFIAVDSYLFPFSTFDLAAFISIAYLYEMFILASFIMSSLSSSWSEEPSSEAFLAKIEVPKSRFRFLPRRVAPPFVFYLICGAT